MSTLSLYDATVPLFARSLTNLKAVLEKGEQKLGANTDLTTLQLVEDMKGLPFQVQCATATAKNTLNRINPDIKVPVWEDDETTFAQLHKRIDACLAVLAGVKKEEFVGRESTEVKIRTGQGEIPMTALQSVQVFAIPNFFFHVVMAYSILRAKGVDIGKADFLRGKDDANAATQ